MSDIVCAGDQYYENPKKVFNVTMDITEHCPYTCSYCYEGKGVHKKEFAYEDFCTAITRLTAISSFGLPFRFVFFGGEPLCHPRFLDMVAFAKKKFPNAIFCATSNVYQSIDFLEKLYAIDAGFILHFSVHFEYIKNDEALRKVAFLARANKKNIFNVIYLPEKREQIRPFIAEAGSLLAGEQSRRLYVKLIRSKKSGFKKNLETYTEEDYLYKIENSGKNERLFISMKKNGQYVRKEYFFSDNSEESLMSFTGMLCTYPMHRLRIKIDGRYYSCDCCRDSQSNILENTNINVITAPVPCKARHCRCADQRRSAKFADWKYAPKYLKQGSLYA